MRVLFFILSLLLIVSAQATERPTKVPTISDTHWDNHTDCQQLQQQYIVNKAVWDSIFVWIETHRSELTVMPAGKYYVCDTVLIKLQDGMTREVSKIEAHRRFIDLQWDLVGTEVYELWQAEDVEVVAPYRADKDVEHYAEKPGTQSVVLTSTPKTVYLFFPSNPHRAMLYPQGSGPAPVRKLVAKIPYVY